MPLAVFYAASNYIQNPKYLIHEVFAGLDAATVAGAIANAVVSSTCRSLCDTNPMVGIVIIYKGGVVTTH